MFAHVKLGCLPALHDHRTLRLSRYLRSAEVPNPPESVAWQEKLASVPMYLNDRIGCCVVATAAHLMRAWSTNDGAPYEPTDQQVLADYSALSGYDPATGRNDNGAVILDRYNRWRREGICGNRLGAYAGVQWLDHREVMAAIHLFGGVDLGIQLPAAWQTSDVWDVAPNRFIERRFWRRWAPGSWGGHNAPAVGYDERYLYLLTWGKIVPMSWAALERFTVEAYVPFNTLWVGGDGIAPNGFDVAMLNSDLRAIGAN